MPPPSSPAICPICGHSPITPRAEACPVCKTPLNAATDLLGGVNSTPRTAIPRAKPTRATSKDIALAGLLKGLLGAAALAPLFGAVFYLALPGEASSGFFGGLNYGALTGFIFGAIWGALTEAEPPVLPGILLGAAIGGSIALAQYAAERFLVATPDYPAYIYVIMGLAAGAFTAYAAWWYRQRN